MGYFQLGLAIVCECVATISLKESDSFSKLGPTVLCVVGYISTFYFMSLSMRTIPVSISYAIWSAVGLVLITLLAAVRLDEKPDFPAIIGLTLIVAGVICLKGWSNMSTQQ